MNKILYLELEGDRSDFDDMGRSADKKRHNKISKYFGLEVIDNFDQGIDLLNMQNIDAIITNYYGLRKLNDLAEKNILDGKSIILVSCLAKNGALDKIKDIDFERIYRNNRSAEKHIKEIRGMLDVLRRSLVS